MSVTTNKADYAPGETAEITALVTTGGRLEITVSHLDLPGADGFWGTADDVLDAVLNNGSGHAPAVAIDGGPGDADGLANGIIVYEWYVNPDDSLGERFRVSVREVREGADGAFGTADDVQVGATRYATFTDALPPPIQTYYVPLPEDELDTSFGAIDSGADGYIRTEIGVAVAAPGTIVYYDHWEDGYESDVTAPMQATTEIWGDGDLTNGVAPGVAGDVFGGGESIVLDNNVPVPRNPATIFYDGGDRIQASFPIAVTRAAFQEDPGSVLAGAVETASTDAWGLAYAVPIGEDTDAPGYTDAFQYTAAYVMAGADDTTVTVSGQGTFTLNQGETRVFRVDEGDNILASKPVQVDLVTGDIGSSWEMRWYSLSPTSDWTNEYFAPFAEEIGDTGFWFYNPNNASITVNYDRQGATDLGGFVVAPNSSLFIRVDNGADIDLPGSIGGVSGLRFFTEGGETFHAMAQIDADGDGSIFDWGYPLVPSDQLTSQALIGLGYGNTTVDPNEPSNTIVWVTAVADAEIRVDFDGDGVIDQTFDAEALETIRIWDDGDSDMSGAMITAVSATAPGNLVNIAVAWGQDPSIEDRQNLELDYGTVIRPLPELAAQKNASLYVDNDGDGLFDPGDQIEYTITVVNTSPVDIPAGGYSLIDFLGPLLVNVDYQPGSTTFTRILDPGGDNIYGTADDVLDTTPIVDDGSGTPFPLDEAYYSTDDLSGNSAVIGLVGEIHTYTFRVTIKDFEDLEPGTTELVNTGELLINDEDAEDLDNRIPLDADIGIDIEKATNGEDADLPFGPLILAGDPVTWTYAVTNTGVAPIANVVVVDDNGTPSDTSDDFNPTYVSGDDDGDSLLDVDEVWEYEAASTASLGLYGNDATVTGTAVYGDGVTPVPTFETVTDSDPSHYLGIPQPREPGFVLRKFVVDVDGEGPGGMVNEAGDVITYLIAVANTGDSSLPTFQLDDPLLEGLNGTLNGPVESVAQDGTLEAGEVWLYEGTYTVQQADIDAHVDPDECEIEGTITNTATGSAILAPDQSDTVEVPIEFNRHATVDKRVVDVGGKGPNGYADVGDVISYEVEIVNDGNVTYDDVMFKDMLLEGPNGTMDPIAETGGTGTNGDGILDVGETWTVTGTYTVQQSDIDNNGIDINGNPDNDGDIDNMAILWVSCGDITDHVVVPIFRVPAIQVSKTVLDVAGQGPNGAVDNVGDVITYQIQVANTGNVAAHSVTIADDMLQEPNGVMSEVVEQGGTGTNGDGVLDPGEVWTLYGQYTVTEADFYSNGKRDGDIDNTVVVSTDILPEQSDSVEVQLRGGAIINGTKKNDAIKPGGDAGLQPTDLGDRIYGKKGKDKIKGLDGNDWIVGGKHSDKLVGGAGLDSFVFDTKVKSKHKDKIKDFEVGLDKIVLIRKHFDPLKFGILDDAFFHVGGKPKSKKDIIIYNKKTGALTYDSDGKKGGDNGQVFAKVDKNLDLSAEDFFVC